MILRNSTIIAALACLAACGDKPGEAETSATSPATPVEMPRSPSQAGARVFFISPADGATVTNPVRVEFGIEGMAVVKAGVQQAHSGHHHLLINTDLPDPGLPIPADEQHIHFGDGSTSTEITLPPGQHSLQMLLGDYVHIPHDPPLSSAKITITIE